MTDSTNKTNPSTAIKAPPGRRTVDVAAWLAKHELLEEHGLDDEQPAEAILGSLPGIREPGVRTDAQRPINATRSASKLAPNDYQKRCRVAMEREEQRSVVGQRGVRAMHTLVMDGPAMPTMDVRMRGTEYKQ